MWSIEKSSITKAGIIIFFILFLGHFSIILGAPDIRLSAGQTLYVPVYSNIFTGPKQIPFHLAAILSIRNTDLSNSIKILSADYYDTKGKLLKRYFDKEIGLGPLESTFIYLSEDDNAGGFGANFIVRWVSSKEVNPPVVECLMVGMKSGQGVSFVNSGQIIKENTK
jgi:hypothetical protein